MYYPASTRLPCPYPPRTAQCEALGGHELSSARLGRAIALYIYSERKSLPHSLGRVTQFLRLAVRVNSARETRERAGILSHFGAIGRQRPVRVVQHPVVDGQRASQNAARASSPQARIPECRQAQLLSTCTTAGECEPCVREPNTRARATTSSHDLASRCAQPETPQDWPSTCCRAVHRHLPPQSAGLLLALSAWYVRSAQATLANDPAAASTEHGHGPARCSELSCPVATTEA